MRSVRQPNLLLGDFGAVLRDLRATVQDIAAAMNDQETVHDVVLTGADDAMGSGITGGGVANRVAFWSGPSTLSSHSSLLFDPVSALFSCDTLALNTSGPIPATLPNGANFEPGIFADFTGSTYGAQAIWFQTTQRDLGMMIGITASTVPAGHIPRISFWRADGTLALPTPTKGNQWIGAINAGGYDGVTWTNHEAGIRFHTGSASPTHDWSATSHPVAISILGIKTNETSPKAYVQFGPDDTTFNPTIWYADVRVRGTGAIDLLYVDAINNRVGVNKIPTAGTLNIAGYVIADSVAQPEFRLTSTSGAPPRSFTFISDGTTAYIKNLTDGLGYFNIRDSSNKDVATFQFAAPSLSLVLGASKLTINDTGADYDVSIEGVGQPEFVYLDASLNRVGIGITAPDGRVVVRTDGQSTLYLDSFNVNATQASIVRGRRTLGTLGSPLPVLAGTDLVRFESQGRSDAASWVGGAVFRHVSAEDFTATAAGTRMEFWPIVSGTTTGVRALDLRGDKAFFNPNNADYDFHVRSQGGRDFIFVDANEDRMGFGTSALLATNQYIFVVGGVDSTETVFRIRPGTTPLTANASVLLVEDYGGNDLFNVFETSLVVNDGGLNFDVRFEGVGEPALLFLDASAAKVAIGGTNPQAQLHIIGSGVPHLRISNVDGATAPFSSVFGICTAGAQFMASTQAYDTAIIARTFNAGAGTGGQLLFGTHATEGSVQIERLRITAEGWLRFNVPQQNCNATFAGTTELNMLHLDADTNRILFGLADTAGEARLHASTDGVTNFFLDTYSATPGDCNDIVGRRARGSRGTPGQVQTGDLLLDIIAYGRSNVSTWVGGAAIEARAVEAFTASAAGTAWDIYTIAVGGLASVLSLTIGSGVVALGAGVDFRVPGTLVTQLFRVDQATDTIEIRDLSYFWPSSHGAGSRVLTNDGAGNLTWAAAGGSTHTVLDSTVHTDTVTAVPAQGALILGNAEPKWDRLLISATVNTYLRSNGTTAAWSDLLLSNPTDASWADGLFTSWTSGTTKVMDALDDVSEVLKELAPANALPMSTANLPVTEGFTNYAGRASGGNANYKTAAGETWTEGIWTRAEVDYWVEPYYSGDGYSGGNDCFSEADLGTVYLEINSVPAGSWNLGASFQEIYRDGMQIWPPATNLALTVSEVGKYNNFKRWQRGRARCHMLQALWATWMRQGYNYYQFKHDPGSGMRLNPLFECFFDDSGTGSTPTTPSFSVGTALAEVTKIAKYLSGVQFYTTNSTFNLTATLSQLFANTYQTDAVTKGDLSGASASAQVNVDPAASSWNGTVSTPPHRTDAPALGVGATKEVVTLTVASRASLDGRLTITLRQPGRSNVTNQSASQNRLLNTYASDPATSNTERFLGEDWRLPSTFDFDDKVTSMPATAQWDETAALTTGNAQAYQDGSANGTGLNKGALIYPQHNFSSGYLPSQAVNYSAFSGNQRYWRAFTSATARSNGVIRVYGIGSGGGAIGTGDFATEGTDDKLAVSFRLPTLTAWADAIAAYDSGDPTPLQSDGEGARDEALRTGSDGNGSFVDIPVTFDGYSTANSGNRIYVRVTFTSSGAPTSGQKARKITRVELRVHNAGSTGGLW